MATSERETEDRGPPGDRIATDHDSDGTPDSTADAGRSSTGIRARLAVRDPPGCAVASALPAGASATDVTWTRAGDRIVNQFRSRADADATPIFETAEKSVYRLERSERDAQPCPCRIIESLGYPVDEVTVTTNPSQLVVSLLLPSPEPLAEIVAELEAIGASVSLQCLVRSFDGERADSVLVDRGRLTDRQQEVLETAYRMGYFSYPRETSAAEVADALGIVRSTFAEHLAAAQRRLLEAVFETARAGV
ncbi:helix-turn-helix domain-containing protein [Halobiforma nitratireducens]|uniref:DNA binding protein n=1 Tax=Halobiforma nitratireducens JCM 10879 TaxID=1227454 RepID=M0LD71_9EURY|nr:helix-turn-helix domain-containing protein [Halobiforma nitratireducens]EMA31053.1 DNA binding protein [Halobiforma nitratireducens JCM 10879]